ncbi:MAG: glycosyltransferase family 39 protein [Elusimicrobiota bacterium]
MKNNTKTLLLILFVSFILRIGYIFIFPQEKILTNDQIGYDAIAYNLITGNGFSIKPHIPTPIRPPVYPFFLSLIYFIFGHSYIMVRVFQAILDALTCVILYYLAKEIFDERIANLSAWLIAFYPVLIVYTGLLLSETLFTFLFIVSIFLFIKWFQKTKIVYFIGCGIFLGFATLTRPVTILFPFVVLLSIIIIGRKNYLQRFIQWFIFLIAFILIVLPWSIRNYRLFETIEPCSIGIGGGLFIAGNMASGLTYNESFEKILKLSENYPEQEIFISKRSPDIEREKKCKQEGIKLIRANFKNYILLLIKRLPRFWWTSHSSIFGVDKSISEYLSEKNYFYIFIRSGLLLLHGIFLILAFGGIVLSRKNWQNSVILILILIYFTGHITFETGPRYQLPTMPYLFIFTSVCIYKIFEKLKNLKN